MLRLAYKKDVSHIRELPTLDIIHLLEGQTGDLVEYHDPYVSVFQHDGMEIVGDGFDKRVQQADCVVIVT